MEKGVEGVAWNELRPRDIFSGVVAFDVPAVGLTMFVSAVAVWQSRCRKKMRVIMTAYVLKSEQGFPLSQVIDKLRWKVLSA